MRAPHFWSAGLDPRSREAAPLLRFLLSPFALLYGWVTARRISRTTPTKIAAPVICIGNLTAGGSGKTPIVAALRQLLSERDIDGVSLSRGYGGRLKGPTQVNTDQHDAQDVGDEPLLLASQGEAWIGQDKVATAQAISAGRTCVVLLDDGHQNPSLHKDLSLVVIDAQAPFGNGHVIPKGPLREPVMAGLKRASAAVLMGDGEVPAPVIASGLPVMRARLQPASSLPEGPLIAFAGIGRPDRFFDHLRRIGGDVRDSLAFADHHNFSASDLKRLREFAEVHEARLVTTEKDYMRLSKTDRETVTPVKVRAVFDDESKVMELLSPLLDGMGR